MPFDFDDDDVMPPEQMKSPVLVTRGHVLVADFDKPGPHRFGGPLDLKFGQTTKSPVFHRVVTLSLKDPTLAVRIDGITELPLIYGFVHDGCELTYRVKGDREIEF